MLGHKLLQFIPPRLEPEEEWERDGVGEVHVKPLYWTTTPPDRPGFWWVRFPGLAERDVIQVKAGDQYLPSRLEWSSQPCTEPGPVERRR